GIRTAMGGRHARRLCPHAIVVSPRMAAYTEASKAMFEVFEDATPLVEGLSIDEAFLDVRGLRRISGTPAEIAARLRRSPDHGRRGADEVPREGRERGRQAGRPARRATRRRARLPPSAPGRASVGRRTEDRRAPARPRDPDGRPGGAVAAGGARGDAR